MALSFNLKRRHRIRQVALFVASLALLGIVACQDDPLAVPRSQRPADTAGEGGEASAGGQGGDGGTLPYGYGAQAAASYGAWTGVEPPPVAIAGTTSSGGSGGGGGSGGTGGPAINKNCGDGNIDPGEECDDGNKLSGDGCSSNCISRCETCEKNECINYDPDFENWYDNCFQMEGKAEGGPAVGVPRAELCAAVVDCVRAAGCARRLGEYALEFEPCYCQYETPGEKSSCNQADFVRGPCYREFQEASEQEGFGSTMWGYLSARSRAIGPAYQMLQGCDHFACRDECLPETLDAGEVTTISEDLDHTATTYLVADAQRAAGLTDFALVDPRAVAYPLMEAASPNRAADAAGRVLWSELVNVFYGYNKGENPSAGSQLQTMTVTGQMVYDALNEAPSPVAVSGLTYTYDLRLPARSRVVEVQKDGVAINKDSLFTLTIDNVFRLPGIANATNVVTITSTPLDALVQHLQSLPAPVGPPANDRITLLQ